MDEPRIGQRVITHTGDGIVTTITAGSADTDVLRYRISHGATHRWHYLDEIITIPDTVAVER